MKYRPDRIVDPASKLTLRFGCRDTFLRADQKMYRDEPIAEWPLGTVHDTSSLEVMAVAVALALGTLLVRLPPIFSHILDTPHFA